MPSGISISSWYWTFGDGQTSSVQNPTITYSDIGVYDVQLTVTFDNGSTDQILKDYITVIERLIEKEETFIWNTASTPNSGSYFGFWSHDNINSWEHLGWPDENMSSYGYAGNSQMVLLPMMRKVTVS